MSRGRGRRGSGGHAEEEHVDERWLVSYADMITVLMCLFLVLFAMSTVDAAKYELLKNSLATGFGSTPSETVDTAEGVIVPEELVDENGAGFTAGETDSTTAEHLADTKPERLTVEEQAKADADQKAAEQEVADLKAVEAQVDASLSAAGLAQTVQYTIDERGLTIRLVGSETFFGTNSTALSGTAVAVLGTVGPIVAGTTYGVSIEGHADQRASSYPFPTNWELSSGRATEVLRYLVERGGVGAERISATGYGSSRPLSPGTTPDELAANRRVDIVVLSDETEAVRDLLAATAAGGTTTAAAMATPAASTEAADHKTTDKTTAETTSTDKKTTETKSTETKSTSGSGH